MTALRVFLSHAGPDGDAARALKQRILAVPAAKAAGLDVWLDLDDLQPGRPWLAQIEVAMAEADACMIVVGDRGITNWVRAELDLAMGRAVKEDDFRLIPVLLGETSSEILTPFARRFHAVRDPLGSDAAVQALVEALLERAGDLGEEAKVLAPFPGLRSMNETWSDLFFGRRSETDQLLEMLRDEPIVSIVAASGAGKSSLAMAGLAAAWRGGGFAPDQQPSEEDPIFWNVVLMRPADNALEGLKSGVRRTAEQLGLGTAEQDALLATLQADDPSRALFGLECGLPAGRVRTLLVLDQAEELVTATTDRALRHQFGQLIGDMAKLGRQDGRLRVVLTLRDDYANRVHDIPGLDQHAQETAGVLRLKLPAPTVLREVIENPLRLAGYDDVNARDEFVEQVLSDMSERPGDMALLQMALNLAWRDREQHGGLLAAYYAKGRVFGALGQEAKRVTQSELNAAQRAQLMPLFMRLVRLGESSGATRRVASKSEFTEEQITLVDLLSGPKLGRLLLVRENTVEIAHESMIAQWPELGQYVDDNKTNLKTLHRLTAETDRWFEGGQPKARLAKRADLEDFEPLARNHSDWMTNIEEGFLRTSRSLVRRTRAWVGATAVVVCGLAVLAAVLFGSAQNNLTLAQEAEANADSNRRTAIALLAGSRAPTEPENALRLILSAWPVDAPPEAEFANLARNVLSTALSQHRPSIMLTGHEGSANSIDFSPDGGRVVSGGGDGTVRIWDTASGAELLRLLGHEGAVNSVGFSPDGGQIVSGGIDQTVRIWDAASGAELQRLPGHEGAVWSVDFSPDGRRVVSGGQYGTALIWDAASGTELQRLMGLEAWVRSVDFSPDGRRIVSSDGGSDGDDTLRIWDAASGAELQALTGHEGSVQSVDFSPDGGQIASGGSDGAVRIWDAASGAELQRLTGHEGGVWSVDFSPDGRRVVSGGQDQTVRIWGAASGAELLSLTGREGPVHSVGFSSDGTWIVSGGEDGTVRIWDPERGTELQGLTGHSSRVRSIDISPDGDRIVSGSRDGTVQIWVTVGRPELQPLTAHEFGVNSVSFSPDGDRIVTGGVGGTVLIWDATSGAELQRLAGHEGNVNSVAIGPDGGRIVTGDSLGIVRIWDAVSGAELQRWVGHESAVESVGFSPDGGRIVSGGQDGTVRVWRVALRDGNALQIACQYLPTTIGQRDLDVSGLAREIGVTTLDPIESCDTYTPPMPISWSLPE